MGLRLRSESSTTAYMVFSGMLAEEYVLIRPIRLSTPVRADKSSNISTGRKPWAVLFPAFIAKLWQDKPHCSKISYKTVSGTTDAQIKRRDFRELKTRQSSIYNSIDSFPLHLLCYNRLSTREAVCLGYKCNHKMPGRRLDCYFQDSHSYIPPGNYQVECHIDTGL